MANTIKLKRGKSTNLSQLTLQTGEIALTTDTNAIYSKNSSGVIENITPKYKLTKSGSTITLTGTDGTTTSVTDSNSNTTYSAGTGLSLSGTTFSVASSGVTAGTYGPTADVSGTNNSTVKIPEITVDATGRVTKVTARTLTNKDTNTTYSAATTSANGLMTSTDKTNLNAAIKGLSVSGKVITYTKVDGSTGTITTQDTNTTYSAATTSANGLMSAADKTKLDGIATGANKYTLPTAGSSLGGVKTTSTVTSNSGYTACPIISGVPYYKDTNTTYSAATTSANGLMSSTDKTNLNAAIKGLSVSGKVITYTKVDGSTGTITTQDNNTTYSAATTSAAGLMSAADKTKLDGIATGANKYTLPTASSSTLGGVKTTSTVTSNSGYTACPIISGVPYYKDTNTTYSLSSFGITATAAELNILDGVTATATELNYVDGVTSNIQTQLNGKAASSHTHSYLPLSGGTMTGQIKKAGVSSSWIKGRDNAVIRSTSINGYSPFASIKTKNGSWEIGAYDNSSWTDDLVFAYCTDTNYTANTNNTTATIRFYEDGSSDMDITGTAAKATNDSAGQQINTTYIKGLSVSGKTITYTKGNGTTGTISTQDTTYSAATTSANGLMTSAMVTKLNGIETGATKDNVQVSTTAPTASNIEVWVDPSGAIDLSALWNSVYPVGSIYMSVTSTDPKTFFPGTTWTRLKDRFLLGAGDTYSNGATGGSANLQSHTHSIPALSGTAASAGSHNHLVTSKTTSYGSGSQSSWRCLSWTGTNADWSQDVYSGDSGSHTHSVTTTASTSGSAGSGSAQNMPPYLVVYMWKRTA